MKKGFIKLTLIIMSIVLALSFSACNLTFIDNTNTPPTNNGGGDTSSGTQASLVSKYGGISSTKLLNSLDLVSEKGVEFNQSSSTTELKQEDAVELIETSAVALKLSSNGSTYSGSGIIVDLTKNQDTPTTYYVITCHHVIRNGGNISVFVMDKERDNYGDDEYDRSYEFKGVIDYNVHNNSAVTLVGGDSVSDVAVLKIDTSKHQTEDNSLIDMSHVHKAKVSPSSREIAVGQKVFAIGNPSGMYPATVTDGTISYLYRDIAVNSIGYQSLIQHSASTIEGSSGGGLFNLYGDLIGITNAGNTSARQINFAIPASVGSYVKDNDGNVIDNGFINIAKNLLATQTQTNYGYVSGRWELGVTVSASLLNYNDEDTVPATIEGVLAGSNADMVGIKVGDNVIGATFKDNTGTDRTVTINTFSEFRTRVYQMKYFLGTKDSITLKYTRKTQDTYYGDRQEYSVTIPLDVQYIFCNTGNYTDIQKSA